MVLTKLLWGFFKIEFPILNDFFPKTSSSPLYHMVKTKTSIIWKASDCRAKLSEIYESQTVP